MLQIRLGEYKKVDPATDDLGRSQIGSYPGISQQDAWQAGRGVWKLKPDRALAEDEAQIIDLTGEVLAVATITGIRKCGDRFALEGDLLSGDQRVGKPTTSAHLSRNPVGYF